jgi:hypothetical protein
VASPLIFLHHKEQVETAVKGVKDIAFQKYQLISDKIPKHEKKSKKSD